MVPIARPEELKKPQEPPWYKIAVQQVKGAEHRQENAVSTDLSLGGLFKKGWRKDAAEKADRKRPRDFKPCERDEPFVPGTGTKWRHLFDKTLTRTDARSNLVISSKYAKHFAADLPSPALAAAGASDVVVTKLSFVDEEGKLWRFGYKYCARNKACVIGSRWRYFVRDRGLEAEDEISFYRHTETNKMAIGVTKKSAGNASSFWK